MEGKEGSLVDNSLGPASALTILARATSVQYLVNKTGRSGGMYCTHVFVQLHVVEPQVAFMGTVVV